MPSTSRSTTLTIRQLEVSPFNVRTNKQDTAPNDAFDRTILAFGLIHPLRVHPMLGRKNVWGVHCGARRYRSVRKLIESGALPPDWPVDVMVREGASDAELLEESGVENQQRTDLRPYEMFLGVAKAHRRGDPVALIAHRIGQEEAEVARWVRLGNLAKPVFEALEAGRLTVEQARAYASTEDHALQTATFAEFSKQPSSIHWLPAQIRAHMGVGDAEAKRLLRFIGADAYVDAGGRIERDLFAEIEEGADRDRSRVLDPGILRRLVDAKLDDERATLRERTGRPNLRFERQPPRTEFGTDWTLEITALSPDDNDGIRIALPDGDVVATLTVGRDGAAEAGFWWASKAAKAAAGRTEAPRQAPPALPARMRTATEGAAIGNPSTSGDPNARRMADAGIRSDDGLSADGVQIFRSIRRTILRGALVKEAGRGIFGRGDVAADWLVWSQLRLVVADDRRTQIGAGQITGSEGAPDPAIAHDHVRATEAWHAWSHALYELQQQTFLTGGDLSEAFLDYRASSTYQKALATAVVAGLSLERSLNAGTYQLVTHDTLAAELGLSDAGVRKLWAPTAALLDLIPRDQRRALAEPFVERAAFGPWSRLKSADLTRAVLGAVTGVADNARTSMHAAALRWVHPLLRFGEPEPDAPEDAPIDDTPGDDEAGADESIEYQQAAE